MKINIENPEYQKKLKIYYLKCLFSELSKIVIFFVFFFLTKQQLEYWVALFALMLLRSIGGGLHFKHYLSCLFVSFLFLYVSILLSNLLHVTPNTKSLLLILSGIYGYYLVPITSSNRPPATGRQIIKCKYRTLIIILLFSNLIYFCPNEIITDICFWTVILHIIQLTIAKWIHKEVKRNERLGN